MRCIREYQSGETNDIDLHGMSLSKLETKVPDLSYDIYFQVGPRSPLYARETM